MKAYILTLLFAFCILVAYACTKSQDRFKDHTACNCDTIDRDYYSNGSIRLETAMVNGKVHGLKRLYYEDGKIWREVQYSNGLLNGDFMEYGKGGKPVVTAFFVNDSLK